jgi:hypothetical protein
VVNCRIYLSKVSTSPMSDSIMRSRLARLLRTAMRSARAAWMRLEA